MNKTYEDGFKEGFLAGFEAARKVAVTPNQPTLWPWYPTTSIPGWIGTPLTTGPTTCGTPVQTAIGAFSSEIIN